MTLAKKTGEGDKEMRDRSKDTRLENRRGTLRWDAGSVTQKIQVMNITIMLQCSCKKTLCSELLY